MKINWHYHHIIPKHMGGTDNPDNLLKVNTAMHAFLHKCLYEDYGLEEDRLAWLGLSGQKPFRVIDEELENIRRKKISQKTKGKIVSTETRLKMSFSAKKRANSEKGKNHLISISNNGLGKPRSEETKKKISEGNRNKIFSESTRKKMSEAAKRRSESKESKETFLRRIGKYKC